MKAFELKEATGFDGLVINPDRAEPEPGPGEVKIRLKAAAINYRDLLVAKGQYRGGAKPDCIPFSDGAGEVVSVGANVRSFKPGDRVIGAFFEDWESGPITPQAIARGRGAAIDGMLAEYAICQDTACVHTPPHLSDVEAATLPCAAVTAWNAVVEVGQVKSGDTVLLLGTGSVSLFALQFAKMLGARTIITSGRDEKLLKAKGLGADEGINYTSAAEWDKSVLGLTGGKGADIVIEVGGPGTLERSIRAARVGGTVALIGVLTGAGQIDPRPLISRAIRLQGVFIGSTRMLRDAAAALHKNNVKPVIDSVVPFANAREAYRKLESGAQFGKIVVEV